MKTIAFFNVKGGVGKTTSAVNIAYLAAKENTSTLLWDLDPQSCASWYLGVSDDAEHKALRIFKGKTPVGHLRINTAYPNLQVIPSDISLRKLEILLGDEAHSKKLLQKLAENLSEKNKLLIFDCAPAFSKVSENIFNSTDILVVPLLPSPLSLRSFQQLKDYVYGKKQWKHLKIHPFFTMVDRRRKIHNSVIEDAKKLIGIDSPICIPYSNELEKMGIHQRPIHEYAAKSPGALTYQSLWEQLKESHNLL